MAVWKDEQLVQHSMNLIGEEYEKGTEAAGGRTGQTDGRGA